MNRVDRRAAARRSAGARVLTRRPARIVLAAPCPDCGCSPVACEKRTCGCLCCCRSYLPAAVPGQRLVLAPAAGSAVAS